MGKVKEMLMKVEELVWEAAENGAQNENEVETYLRTYHSDFNIEQNRSVLNQVYDEMVWPYVQNEDDGQPDEAQEWYDFDPDC